MLTPITRIPTTPVMETILEDGRIVLGMASACRNPIRIQYVEVEGESEPSQAEKPFSQAFSLNEKYPSRYRWTVVGASMLSALAALGTIVAFDQRSKP